MKPDLRLLNVETVSIYLKVPVFKKMRRSERFTILSIKFKLKPLTK